MVMIKEQTLHSALCGLEGVLYANTVGGALDSMKFSNFFGEAGQVTTQMIIWL